MKVREGAKWRVASAGLLLAVIDFQLGFFLGRRDRRLSINRGPSRLGTAAGEQKGQEEYVCGNEHYQHFSEHRRSLTRRLETKDRSDPEDGWPSTGLRKPQIEAFHDQFISAAVRLPRSSQNVVCE
ncbi:hypothetical protein AB1L88_00645 [Tautonia sp. JC769]|uniref:hypothetical protein n=1 Tax=Tautonia sp. JC769 TaxID=3232135 RepID=UPI003459307C